MTVRCPKCQRKNNVPAGGEAKARCGACGAALMPSRGGGLATTTRASGGVSPFGGTGAGGPGSPFGPGGAPPAASPFGIGGLGGGDPSGARMRQARATGRTASTGGASRLGGQRPANPRAALIQGWDELLHLAPADMGLTAAMGVGSGNTESDPISWLSAMSGVPREELEQVRQVRNNAAAGRQVPDSVIAGARQTLDRALAVLGRTRLPE